MYKRPRFAESGLVARPHGPTSSGVDPSATTAPLNITLGREQQSQRHTLMPIIFSASPHLSGLSLWPHLPVSDCRPTPIAYLPVPPTVCLSHRHTTNLMGPSSHQNGFSIGVQLPNGNASYHLVTRLYQASQKLKNGV
jgi:hypothetical protein